MNKKNKYMIERNNEIESNQNESDAILRTGDEDVREELDNLVGYKEYIREQSRLSEY